MLFNLQPPSKRCPASAIMIMKSSSTAILHRSARRNSANEHRVRAPWAQYEATLDGPLLIKRFRVSNEIFHKVLDGICDEIERDPLKAKNAGSELICK